VIRLLKYVRDSTYGLNIKSVILTTLVGRRVGELKPVLSPGCYADLPTTLKTVIDDLDDYLQQNYFLPTILDPGGSGDHFDERWDQEGYAAFRTRIHALREKIDTAFDTEGTDASLAAWQAVFGTAFKAPVTTTAAGRGAIILVEGKALPVTERFLDRDLGIPFALNGHTVRMVGFVKPNGPLAGYRLPDHSNRVDKHRELLFTIEACNIAAPYQVYWKIRNTGAEAERAGSLRGEIIKTTGSTHTESTLYPGSHWVECYIVRDGRCVARARQPVIVT
jgi:hypothetical protein